VKYKILIKRCVDPRRLESVASAIAQWSGNTPETVKAALSQKAVCIRQEADEAEAARLQQHFGNAGAEVELVKLSPVGAAAVTDDDDDEEEEGRVLTDEEYARELKRRGDIFTIEKDRRIGWLQLLCLGLAIGLGAWLSTRDLIEVATDFFEKIPEERVAKIVKDLPETLQKKEEKKEEIEEIKTEKKKLKPAKSKGAGGRTGGGGDPRARVTQKGVLGIISGRVKGKTVASADIFGKGGYATGIDAILSGVGGLKEGADGGSGRKGVAGIGFGAGVGSGFGGGSGGVDDLLGSLMGGGGGGNLNLKKRGELKVQAPEFVKGGALTGGRSKASIMRVVMQNLAALRYAYNKRLREKPGLNGKVTVKFAIDEFGKVIFCEVINSSMGDSVFEKQVVGKIRRWVFDKIDKPGDVTEVVYPFVFSN